VDDLVASVPRGDPLGNMANVEGVGDRALHERYVASSRTRSSGFKIH
jgi:hypothetical protein